MNDDTVPLRWPESRPKAAKRGFQAWLTEKSDATFAREGVAHQLRERPKPEPERWGETVTQMRVGQVISKVLEEVYEWPNDHFIPEDPFDVALFMPWDRYDVGEVRLQLEERLCLEMDDWKLYDLSGSTLRDLADYLMSKIASQEP